MIEVKNLTKKFGKTEVLSDVSLTLNEGGVMGLVGVNGAGKSTLLRVISGVYTPDGGCVTVDGEPRDPDKNGNKIFFLPDDPYYDYSTNAMKLFDLYKVFYPRIDREAYVKAVSDAGLDPKKPLRACSKGMRRQLFALLALQARPKYLLLDEAFDGLDVRARAQFVRGLGELADREGTAVLVASHSLRELSDFCDSYVLIDGGRIVSEGALDEQLEKLCRFSLAYDHEIGRALFAGLPVVHFAQEGRFVRLLLKGNADDMEKLLEKTSPAVMERREVRFEDLFIGETEGGGIEP